MNLFGYICIHTKNQNAEQEQGNLQSRGITPEHIYIDTHKTRPEYKKMLQCLTKGDIVYLNRLEDLANDRSMIIKEWKEITHLFNADIIVLDPPALFDSRIFKNKGKVGQLMESQFFNLVSYFTNRKGPIGRPKKEITDKFRKIFLLWKGGKISADEAIHRSGYGKTTFYKLAKQLTKGSKS